jgi:magnesium transporter
MVAAPGTRCRTVAVSAWEDRRVIVDAAVYRDGKRDSEVGDLADALRVCRDGESFLWIGLHEPTLEELERTARELGLHELAVEDAVKAHQRPKLEPFRDSVLVVLRTARYLPDTESVDFGEILMFVGRRFVVVVRHGEASELGSVRKRLESRPDLLRHGPPAVVYGIVDHVVDDYAPVLDGIEDDIEELESEIFSPSGGNPVERIYQLKREVIELNRVATPLLTPLAHVLESDYASQLGVADELRPYFRDVHDHLVRVTERVAAARELLTSALEANLAQMNTRQNEDMRKISAWVAIGVVPTLITGIYGMNFEHLPGLARESGPWIALAIMLGVAALLWVFFRRRGWL